MHTQECLKQQAEIAARRAAWMERFPGYCPDCEGAGGHEVPATREVPPDYDICGCMDKGYCPRCGYNFQTNSTLHDDVSEGAASCPFCGWNITSKDADQMCPQPFDGCDCTGYGPYDDECISLPLEDGSIATAHVSPDIDPKTVKALTEMANAATRAIKRGDFDKE